MMASRNLGLITLSDSEDSSDESDELNMTNISIDIKPITSPNSTRPRLQSHPLNPPTPTNQHPKHSPATSSEPQVRDDDDEAIAWMFSDGEIAAQEALLAEASLNKSQSVRPSAPQPTTSRTRIGQPHPPQPIASTSALSHRQPTDPSQSSTSPASQRATPTPDRDLFELDDDDETDDEPDSIEQQLQPTSRLGRGQPSSSLKGKGKATEHDLIGPGEVLIAKTLGPVLPRAPVANQAPTSAASSSSGSHQSEASVQVVGRAKRQAAQFEPGHYNLKNRRRHSKTNLAARPNKRHKTTPNSAAGLLPVQQASTIVLPPWVGEDHLFNKERKEAVVSTQAKLAPNERSLCGPKLPGEFVEDEELLNYIHVYEDSQIRLGTAKFSRLPYTRMFQEMVMDANRKELNGSGRIRVIPQPANLIHRSPPFEFHYTNRTIYAGDFLPVKPEGCGCVGNCADPANFAGCACRKRQEVANQTRKYGTKRSRRSDFAYNEEGM